MPDGKIPFDPNNADLDIVRQIVFERLRREAAWRYLDLTGEGFAPYVDYVAPTEFERQRGRQQLLFLAQEVFWQLVTEGVLAPGMDYHNLSLPWFHVTKYGQVVLASNEPQPYDPTRYLARLQARIASPDRTVMAYLSESIETFHKGNRIAATVVLGIAAERVFLLLCGSLHGALSNGNEKTAFAKILERFPMKPKLDWVHTKVQEIQKRAPSGFPDNATIMLTTIYDLMRYQRNELGHPREMPPHITREDAFVNLQIFPRYYEIAEEVRDFFTSNEV